MFDGNLVGAIANEAGLDSQYIGPIHIEQNFTTVDLPADMTAEAMQTLKKTRVMGKQLLISRDTGGSSRSGGYSGGGGSQSRPRHTQGGYGGKKGFDKKKNQRPSGGNRRG